MGSCRGFTPVLILAELDGQPAPLAPVDQCLFHVSNPGRHPGRGRMTQLLGSVLPTASTMATRMKMVMARYIWYCGLPFDSPPFSAEETEQLGAGISEGCWIPQPIDAPSAPSMSIPLPIRATARLKLTPMMIARSNSRRLRARTPHDRFRDSR